MTDPRDDLDPEHAPKTNEERTSSILPDLPPTDTAERFRAFMATGDSVAPQLEQPGDQVGPYRLLSLLGTGGFGSVWLAERRGAFVQRVALKLVKAGMDSRSVVARFEQERQALAVMNHPNIAKVLDGGLAPHGRPYFAMELVKGEPITEFCDARRLGIKDRLRLFTWACEAVQHAHLKGVVHRDIKPSNILAFEVEGSEPSLKVIDFGVAKAMVQPLTDKTIFTETGQMIGTPAYMSPEQADPSSSDIDTRSDIYSLGVLLYELVTGATPFDSKELRKRGYGEIQRILREDDPPSPSARLDTISTKDAELASRIEKTRGVALRDLARELQSELEWIPLKAMRKEPLNRYQTAVELANDVRAYLEGKPIVAAPESRLYRTRKYVRRHRGPVLASLLICGALLSGLSVATWQWRAADLARVAAEQARIEAVEQRDIAEDAREDAETQRRQAVDAREVTNRLLVAVNAGRALDGVRAGDGRTARLALDVADGHGPEDHFVVELARRALGFAREIDLGITLPATHVATCSNGERIALCGFASRGIRCWSDSAEGLSEGPELLHREVVSAAEFSADGRFLASGDESGVVRVWNADVWSGIGDGVHLSGGDITALAFSRDGEWIAAGSVGGAVFVGPSQSFESHRVLHGHDGQVTCVAVDATAGYLLSGDILGEVRLWGLRGAPETPVVLDSGGWVRSVAFNEAGDRILAVNDLGEIRVWDLDSTRPRQRFVARESADICRAVFSPDGYQVLAVTNAGVTRACRVDSGEWIDSPSLGTPANFSCSSLSNDGRFLVAAVDEPTARILKFDLLSAWERRLTAESTRSVAFLDDSRTFATGEQSGIIRIWDAVTGLPLGLPLGGPAEDGGVVWPPIESIQCGVRGSLLGSLDSLGTLRVWRTATRDRVWQRSGDGHAWTCFSIDPLVPLLSVGTASGDILQLDASTGEQVGDPLEGHGAKVLCIARAANTGRLASGDAVGTIFVWEPEGGSSRQRAFRFKKQGPVGALAFSNDGRFLVACLARDVCVWDLLLGESAVTPWTSGQAVSATLLGESRIVAVATADGAVHLLDCRSLLETGAPLRGTRVGACRVAASERGEMLVAAGEDGVLSVWTAGALSVESSEIARLLHERRVRRREHSFLEGEVYGEYQNLRAAEAAVVTSAESESSKRTAFLQIGEAVRTLELAAADQWARCRRAQEFISSGHFEDALRQFAGMSEREMDLFDSRDPIKAAEWWAWVARTTLETIHDGAAERNLAQVMACAERAVKLTCDRNFDHIGLLATACFESGDTQRSLALQRRAYERAVLALGLSHRETRRAARGFGELLRKCGRGADAVKVVSEVLDDPAGANDPWELPGLLLELGLAEMVSGGETDRYPRAEQALRRAFAASFTTPSRILCSKAIIDLYAAWNSAEPGGGFDAKAAEWQAKLDALEAESTLP